MRGGWLPDGFPGMFPQRLALRPVPGRGEEGPLPAGAHRSLIQPTEVRGRECLESVEILSGLTSSLRYRVEVARSHVGLHKWQLENRLTATVNC